MVSSLRALQEFLMKSKRSPKILKCITAFFRPSRTHPPSCRGSVPFAVEPASYSGSPNILTPAGPLNRRPKEGEVGTRIEESFTRCLDVSWDVSVLYSSTEGQEWSHKLLDVLRGGVDGTQLLEGVLLDKLYLEDSAVEMDIQVFAAQTSDHLDHFGTTSAPTQSAGSISQDDNAPIQPDSSPSSGIARSDREQGPSDHSHTGAPPVASPQLLPARERSSRDQNQDSPPFHEFNNVIVSHPHQGPSGGTGGVTMVMRLNPGVPRPGLQTNSGDTTTDVSEGTEYDGGKHKFVCETCGQSFSSKYNVKRHQQSTSAHKADRSGREEGIFCKHCGRKLSRPDALRRHERKGACGKRPGGSGQGGQGSPTALP